MSTVQLSSAGSFRNLYLLFSWDFHAKSHVARSLLKGPPSKERILLTMYIKVGMGWLLLINGNALRIRDSQF